jgi:hypothetical protein
MELPQTAQFVLDIERRQDDVLRELDKLNAQLEQTLAEYQSRLKLFSPCAAVISDQAILADPNDRFC